MTGGQGRSARLREYFRTPFPGRGGFSAYRSPGLLVHLPVLALSAWLGAWLALGSPWLYPLFPALLAAGLYLGRDLAILAHYNVLVTVVVLAAALAALRHAALPPRPGPAACLGLLAAALLLFAGHVLRWIREDRG